MVRLSLLSSPQFNSPSSRAGLCFSVRPGIKIPPSLRNIYKELKEEYPPFVVPTHGFVCLVPFLLLLPLTVPRPHSNLISLARRGVLLLNTSLTVKPHEAGSHSKKGWEEFTDKVVDLVNKQERGVVVLAWGAWAAKRVANMNKVPFPFSSPSFSPSLVLSSPFHTDSFSAVLVSRRQSISSSRARFVFR
jgi:uracil-DNA glycosylase